MATAEGLSFEVLGAVRSVKVTGRILTVSLESNALFMANQGTSSGNGKAPSASASAAAAPSSKYRLTSIEPWRKPRLTEDGRIVPFKNTRQPAEPIPNLGKNRAGQTVSDGKASLRFDENGFPQFNTRFETLLDEVNLGSGKPRAHIRDANHKLHQAISKDPALAQELGLTRSNVDALLTIDKPPPGFRWHHHQDVGRMQFITTQEHELALPHTGGMAIWGGGYP
jgi:hypothetical protein